MPTVAPPAPRAKEFLPEKFAVTDWDSIKSYFEELQKRPVTSVEELERWILDRSELEAAVSEDLYRRYIGITVDTSDQKASERYQYAVQHIMPQMAQIDHSLNEKLIQSPFVDELDEATYRIFLRGVKNEVDLFQEENIPLATELRLKQQQYGSIFGQMSIEHAGETLTLQKAGTLLEETDRQLRETVYHKIQKRILQDREQLDKLFDDLIEIRHKIAQNAGYDNYRDYKFQELGRFDYTPEDCLQFHQSIATELTPVQDALYRIRRERLGLEKLKPWDLSVDWSGGNPLRPFKTVQELVDKTVDCISQLSPDFGNFLAIMDEIGHLDLDSRPGKSPGGYNMPLHFTGVPFIFMNASQSTKDVQTLLHESGHAVHSFLTRDYPLNASKQPTPEIAELASMSMELLSMDYWEVFYDNEEDLKRAKIAQLENVLKTLPWTATIDKFQHWIYTHPQHTQEERKEAWLSIYHEFASSEIDRKGTESYLNYLWHRQLHVFEVPFYYIEYGMAQLGAIAIWKRYREEPKETIADFIEALKLGYTRTIGETYARAGIQFDFSADYVRELAQFVMKELHALTK